MTPQTFIIFGPSGSGKGTQAQLLIDVLKKKDSERKVLYLETGQKFREFAKGRSLASKLVKEVLGSGALLPEFLPIMVWSQYLVDNVEGNEHLIMEGLSRREHEAVVLDAALQFYKRERPIVLLIEVSKECATERLLARGRGDDTVQDIHNRLDWYIKDVTVAVDHFRHNSYYDFHTINGEQSIEDVHAEILSKLNMK